MSTSQTTPPAGQAAAALNEAPTAGPRKPKKGERQLRVNFTEKELLEKGRKLAEAHGELAQIGAELDAIKAQFKGKITRVEGTIGELSGHMTTGWEYRQIPTEITFDDPKPRMKTTRRLDTGEIVEIEQMSMAELQSELPLGDDKKAGVAADGTVKVDADK